VCYLLTLLLCLFPLLPLSAAGEPAAPAPGAGEYTPQRLTAEFGKAVVVILGKTAGGTSLGSGFLVSADGQVVTNYHVVRGAYPAVVKLPSGDVYDDISVIDYDVRRDLAVIKIKGFNLPTVRLGNSDEAKVGEHVVVVGNPEGLENSVSDGLLSGIRDTEKGSKEYQISAPVSPGSSGGPVFNLRGEVIGVVVSTLVEGQNLNFAIPINYARGMLGGPVKCALKDLPIDDAPLLATPGQQAMTEKEAMKTLIEGVTDLFDAWDYVLVGVSKSRSAHYDPKDPFPVDASVDPALHVATELLGRSSRRLASLRLYPGDVGLLACTYVALATRVTFAHEDYLRVLTATSVESRGAALQQHLTAIGFAIDEAYQQAETTCKLCAKVAPELLPSLPIALRDQTPLKEGDGRVGVHLSDGTDILLAVEVSPKSPADRGRLRPGDLILGVVDGPTLTTQAEFGAYVRPRVGQKIVFRVRRGNEEKHLTVTPEAYHP
jgi:S1-C subfamily serine protease